MNPNPTRALSESTRASIKRMADEFAREMRSDKAFMARLRASAREAARKIAETPTWPRVPRARRPVPMYVLRMTPRVRPAAIPPQTRLVRPAPEDEASLREAVTEALRDPGRALTPEELRHLTETGEWPAWCDET